MGVKDCSGPDLASSHSVVVAKKPGSGFFNQHWAIFFAVSADKASSRPIALQEAPEARRARTLSGSRWPSVSRAAHRAPEHCASQPDLALRNDLRAARGDIDMRHLPVSRQSRSQIPGLFDGREPTMRISTNLLALGCQSGPDATLETPTRARSKSTGSRSLRISPLLTPRFTRARIA
jgi:hypothetical protein